MLLVLDLEIFGNLIVNFANLFSVRIVILSLIFSNSLIYSNISSMVSNCLKNLFISWKLSTNKFALNVDDKDYFFDDYNSTSSLNFKNFIV